MKWTKEQERIINLQDSNILVSAAAGSGKTTVMVERIIKLVKNEKIDIDKFLVVTFTNAAAAGMKQKIQKSLVKAAQEEEDIRHIRRQLSLLNKAQITTIHSFCLEVIRKNFHLVGIDPAFRIGDESEINILLQESIDEVLERAYTTNSEDFKTLVESYTSNRGDNELVDIIRRTYNFILSFPDPMKWLEENVDMINMDKEEFKRSPWYKEIRNYIDMNLQGARDVLNLGLSICDEIDGPKVYKATLEEDLNIVDELLSALDKDLILFKKSLDEFKAPRIASFKKNDPINQDVNPDKQEEVKGNIRDEYKKIINSIKPLLPYDDLDQYLHEINSMYEPIVSLKDLIVDLDQIYTNKKLERSLVDYNDLEHYALRILRSSPDVANFYKNKFAYIYIDEYQDSNSIQETIIDQIKRDNNLFMVGDVKQSIYRFRLADPSIFNKKYVEYEEDREDLDDSVIDRVIELNKNFRSREEILEATNYIFSNIMSENLGEIDYSERVYLNCGNEFPNKNPVELNIIEMDSNEEIGWEDADEDSYLELESIEKAEVEARFAAKKVKELIGQEIYDSSLEEKFRSIDYKDIVILLRSVANWSNVFEEVFNEEGIPFFFDGGTGYFQSIEIQVVLNLLRIIDNIRQDISLISVMRSPIASFTTNELVAIRIKTPRGSYINACNNYIRAEEKSMELARKIEDFLNKIYDWRSRSRYTHLDDLIWEILMESNYYNFIGSLPNGKVRQANLRLLTDKAKEFEKTSMRGLFKFLRYIEKLRESSRDRTSTAKTLGENDNVVRLMTIHKSKGLEFPVVLISGLDKMFSREDTKSKILMHKDYGIGSKYVDLQQRVENDTLSRIAIRNKLKSENLSEEMRILYVAMTRAIDKLIMVGTIGKIESKSKKWRQGHAEYSIYRAQSYLDWIGSCLFEGKDLEGLGEIFRAGKVEGWDISNINYLELFKNYELEDKNKDLEKLKELKVDIEPENYREIDRRLNFKYAYSISENTPSKLSVTATNNLNQESFEKLRFNMPSLANIIEFDKTNNEFILDKVDYDGAQIGTLLHLVMEHIDIKDKMDEEGILLELKNLKDRKQITESEEKFLINRYAEKILGFFNSDIGERLRKSPRVKREVPFVIKKKANHIMENLNGEDVILIQGIIDCYFQEDDEVVLIDYKTDSANEDNLEDIRQEYKEQLSLYKEAIEKIKKKRVKESYLYLFSKGILLKID